MPAYKFSDAARVPRDMNPQVVGERLATLTADLGDGFTPQAVVDDARPEGSPLHPAFTWDDTVAAEKYRVEEAKYLIRHVYVLPEEGAKDPEPVRAFVSVMDRESEDDRYMPIARVMSDEQYRDQLLGEALSYFISGRRRYARFSELARIFAAIDREQQKRNLKKAA